MYLISIVFYLFQLVSGIYSVPSLQVLSFSCFQEFVNCFYKLKKVFSFNDNNNICLINLCSIIIISHVMKIICSIIMDKTHLRLIKNILFPSLILSGFL